MATILIVDDRASNREFLTTLLSYRGHRLLEAGDGAEALEVTRAEHPDLVIADILMPTMDGYEFVRQLRADASIAATPVAFCTAHYHEREARALAQSCGVEHVLFKPCEAEAVLQTVDRALGRTPSETPAPTAEFNQEHLRLLTDKLKEKAEALRLANARLTVLVELSLELGSDREPRRLLQTFCHRSREMIGARLAIVGVVNGNESFLRHCITSGMEPSAAARLGSPDPRYGVLREVLAENRSFRLRFSHNDPANANLPPTFPSTRCVLVVPVVSPKRSYGWLCLFDKIGAEEFSAEDERLAGILSAQVGRIYENGSLYADVLRHATDLELQLRDITERKLLEDRLRQAQERFQYILASSPAVLFTLAVEKERLRGISWISDNLGQMLGVKPEAARGKEWFLNNLHPDDRERVVARARTELFSQGGVSVEFRFRRNDGRYRWIQSEMRLIRDQAGRSVEVVGAWSDVTERKTLEDQYRQSQKMEAIGRLAGGVAHDFNNLLTVINGYSELVLEGLAEGEPSREYIREVLAAGNRGASLTRQLLAFSRRAVIEPRVIDLKAVVNNVEKMLRRIIGEDIKLTIAADPEAGAVKADPNQIEQVILNLVVNARDAMPRGGHLAIELSNVELNEAYAAGRTDVRPGPHVMLAVTDTGSGMDETTKAHLFEPFFTTKGEHGTGLGLATVHGIIKQSGGHVALTSEPGKGATFKVYLPRLAQSGSIQTTQLARPSLSRGNETILIVEDDDGIRGLARRILEGCGYTVLECRDGAEALELAGQYAGRIDLLLTDVVLPRMSGREVAHDLVKARPRLKVLYASGYADDAIVRHGILKAEVAFLQKPFTPGSLASKVREVLDVK